MAKTLKPGQRAPVSGVYEIVGPHGGATGKGHTVVRGVPLPPTPKPGQSYVIHRPARGAVVTKSGKVLISAPVKSANSINSWSRAFKA